MTQSAPPSGAHGQMGPSMPPYLERGGEVVYAQPYAALGLRMYAFTLRGDLALLDKMVSRELSAPTGGAQKFSAASSVVLLNFVDIPTLTSAEAPDSWLGCVSEKEAAIWVPVLDQRRKSLLWSVPYLFVDSSIAMATGREVYGFPKQLGQIRIPRDQTAPTALDLRAVCLDKHDPSSVARLRYVIRASRPRGLAPIALTSAWNDAEDFIIGLTKKLELRLQESGRRVPGLAGVSDYLLALARDQAPTFGDVDVALLFAKQLLAERLSMVFLKQFRDAQHPWAACYQGITMVTNTITAFRSGGFLPDDYEIRVADLDGEPISRELGLGTGPLRPEVAFWLEFEFIVELGEVLWDTIGRRS